MRFLIEGLVISVGIGQGLLSLIKVNKQQISDRRFDLTFAFKQVKALLQEKSLRRGLLGFFLFQCAWTLFYQYLPKMKLHIKTLSPSNTSLLLTEVGVGMCVAFCFIVPKAQKYLSPKLWVLSCISLFVFLSCAFLSLNIGWIQFQLISVMMAILYAVGYSAILAYLLSIANDNQKGLILGSVASICAISATITALLGGTLTNVSYALFFQAITFVSFWALLLFIKKDRQPLLATTA